jgi:hypothetical protein
MGDQHAFHDPEPAAAEELERAVCIGGREAHLIPPSAARALCGMAPVVLLSDMGEWQASWRAQAEAYELCSRCAAVAASEEETDPAGRSALASAIR